MPKRPSVTALKLSKAKIDGRLLSATFTGLMSGYGDLSAEDFDTAVGDFVTAFSEWAHNVASLRAELESEETPAAE